MPFARWLVRVSALVAAVALIAGGRVPLGAAQSPVASAIDPANRDASCPACRDFYQFANRGWAERKPRPAYHASWSHCDELDESNLQVLRRGLEKAAASHAAAGSRDQ